MDLPDWIEGFADPRPRGEVAEECSEWRPARLWWRVTVLPCSEEALGRAPRFFYSFLNIFFLFVYFSIV